MSLITCGKCKKRVFVELDEVKRGGAKCPLCGQQFSFDEVKSGIATSQLIGCAIIIVVGATAAFIYWIVMAP